MTAPPQAPVDIGNLALIAMGEAPDLQDLDDPEVGTSEEVMALAYDNARQNALRSQVWNFAQKYDTLARIGDGEDGYADQYRVPNDCVRINILGSDPKNPLKDYKIMYDAAGSTIHANMSGGSMPIRYNKNVDDVLLFDPSFTKYFSLELAEATALAITKKQAIVDGITSRLKALEPKAFSVDGQEQPPIRVQTSKYLAARRNMQRIPTTRYDME